MDAPRDAIQQLREWERRCREAADTLEMVDDWERHGSIPPPLLGCTLPALPAQPPRLSCDLPPLQVHHQLPPPAPDRGQQATPPALLPDQAIPLPPPALPPAPAVQLPPPVLLPAPAVPLRPPALPPMPTIPLPPPTSTDSDIYPSTKEDEAFYRAAYGQNIIWVRKVKATADGGPNEKVGGDEAGAQPAEEAEQPDPRGPERERRPTRVVAKLDDGRNLYPAEENAAPTERRCWNCLRPGHRYSDCPESRRRFCRGCGRWGFTLRSCPTCAEEYNAGNRPPSAYPKRGFFRKDIVSPFFLSIL